MHHDNLSALCRSHSTNLRGKGSARLAHEGLLVEIQQEVSGARRAFARLAVESRAAPLEDQPGVGRDLDAVLHPRPESLCRLESSRVRFRRVEHNFPAKLQNSVRQLAWYDKVHLCGRLRSELGAAKQHLPREQLQADELEILPWVRVRCGGKASARQGGLAVLP